MNFTWSLYQRKDGKWGSKLENGSFNGMVSSLAKGEADLIATSLTLTPVRHEAVDYLVRLVMGILTNHALRTNARI